MKKYIIYIAALILGSACNQMDDMYDEIEREAYSKSLTITLGEDDYAIVGDILRSYKTVEDSAWADLVEDELAFNETITPNVYIPLMYYIKYPALEYGSVVKTTYHSTIVDESLVKYRSADTYVVAAEDYASQGGLIASCSSFSSDEMASEYLPAILASQIASADTGTLLAVSYNYADELRALEGYSYNFDTTEGDTIVDQDGWKQETISGTAKWKLKTYNGASVQMSAYGSDSLVKQESYLISPEINPEYATLNFDMTYGYYNGDVLEVLISSDYTGDVTTATWDNITELATFPTGDESGWTDSEAAGPIDLSSYTEAYHIAFKYVGYGDSLTTTVQIDNFQVGEVLATTQNNDMYLFDGTDWIADEAVMLNESDYIDMGIWGSAFSSSNSPEYYIPKYLEQNSNYAAEGDTKTVVYNYSGTESYGTDIYTLESGEWSSLTDINKQELSAQYVYGNIGWAFDPAIRFTMTSTDYQMMVNYVGKEMSTTYLDKWGNTEYYYGNASYYSNMDVRHTYRVENEIPLTDIEKSKYGIESWTDNSDKTTEIIFDRIKYESMIKVLELKYSDSPLTVGGVEQTYEVTFKTYENDASSNYYTYKYRCTQAGPDAQFEFVEDITE